jgi:8-oxo-dGTP pyrophosphatase MutT (NUDIX family)/ribosomal protein S18 acetylase RimI-like enzyme
MPVYAKRLTSADDAEFALLWQRATDARRFRNGLQPLPHAGSALQRPGAFGVGLFDGEELVAAAVAMPAKSDDARSEQHVPGLAHVSSVATSPTRWGQGLGRQAVRAVLSLAVRRGYARAQLWTQTGNLAAQRAYEREGFTRSGRERLDFRAGDEHIIHYLCDLPVLPLTSRQAARILCLDAGERLLLLHFRDPSDGHQLWEPPGGGIEAGETPYDAVVREWSEETGLPVPQMAPQSTDVARDLVWRGKRWVGDEQFFLGRTTARGTPIPTEGVDQAMDAYLGASWVPWRDLATLEDPLEPDLLPVLRRLDPNGPWAEEAA